MSASPAVAKPRLTPALLRLMDHEKVIEQGLSGMIDMAYALGQIRDQRDYAEAGYSTFEAYRRAADDEQLTAIALHETPGVTVDTPLDVAGQLAADYYGEFSMRIYDANGELIHTQHWTRP